MNQIKFIGYVTVDGVDKPAFLKSEIIEHLTSINKLGVYEEKWVNNTGIIVVNDDGVTDMRAEKVMSDEELRVLVDFLRSSDSDGDDNDDE